MTPLVPATITICAQGAVPVTYSMLWPVSPACGPFPVACGPLPVPAVPPRCACHAPSCHHYAAPAGTPSSPTTPPPTRDEVLEEVAQEISMLGWNEAGGRVVAAIRKMKSGGR